MRAGETMERKITRAEFCNLANRNEDIKRREKAAQQWQERQDADGLEQSRYTRIGKWLKYCK